VAMPLPVAVWWLVVGWFLVGDAAAKLQQRGAETIRARSGVFRAKHSGNGGVCVCVAFEARRDGASETQW
jgi:hypothetical protein